MYKNIMSVGIGGFIGAVLRYVIGEWILEANGFPLSTLIINLLGSFLLSVLLSNTSHRWKIHRAITLGIGTGMIGAFTTFSTFSVETIQLLNQERYIMAITYIACSLLGGILCVIVGMNVIRKK